MSWRGGTCDSSSSTSGSDTNFLSVCLARGRSYTVPPTTLIENCDRWHLSNIADPRDGPMNSMAVLRRDLVGAIPSPVPNRITNTHIMQHAIKFNSNGCRMDSFRKLNQAVIVIALSILARKLLTRMLLCL